MTRMLIQVREITAIVLLGSMEEVALSHGLQAEPKAGYDAQLYLAVNKRYTTITNSQLD